LQERALELADKTEGDFDVSEGIKLVQTEEPSQARSLNEIQLSDDEETREQEVDSLLVDRVARFLGSHTLQFKVPKDSIKDVQRSFEEGNHHFNSVSYSAAKHRWTSSTFNSLRMFHHPFCLSFGVHLVLTAINLLYFLFILTARGKGKKSKKYLLPLLLLLKLKAAALLPLAIGFLALISLKALVIGKLALILSGIIGLKKLLEHKHSASYEVVAHPSHHQYSYDEAHGAFRRSIDAQKLAYAAQKN
jgi:Protein of unknown function (DUF1676)